MFFGGNVDGLVTATWATARHTASEPTCAASASRETLNCE